MSSETHLEDAAPLQEEGMIADVYEWCNLHKLSMLLATTYVAYYLLVIVRVSSRHYVSLFSSCLYEYDGYA